jgi:PAS domain S-box-containing protein
LLKDKLIKFQTSLDFENIKDTGLYTPTRSGTAFIDLIVSDIGSWFLVQIQDITDHKSEEPLQSEEKYRRFFEEDLTGDFIATPEGKILECNPAFAEIYGFDNCKQAAQSKISSFSPDDWENLIERLEKEHKVQGHQTMHKRPDGTQIHVVANVVGIFNDLNDLTQVKGYIFDDTERKKAEEDLKESEEKYHRLFEEDLTGDFIATPEGKILECNPAFAEIYGFDNCKMALQWNISESNPFDWPYIITRLKNRRKIQGYQSWQRRSDGLRIHVVANVIGIFNELNELIQVKGYVFDDTERKHAEEELTNNKRQISEVLNSIQDGFVALNHYWNFIYVNRCAAEYAEAEVDDLLGQNLWERFPELKGTIYETTFRSAMETQKIMHFETHGLHKTDHWFDFSIYPSAEGISIYWRDITSRKKIKKN